MRKYAIALLAVASLTVAEAATLNGKMAVCTTERDYDQLIGAAVTNDTKLISWMLRSEVCVMPLEGTEVSVLDRQWDGGVKLLEYADDGEGVVGWTNSLGVDE